MWLKPLLTIAAALTLSACATATRVVTASVTTQAAHEPGTALLVDPHYRFTTEAAAVGQPTQATLQTMAAEALARVGGVEDDVDPRLSVQVEGHVRVFWVADPYYGGYGGWGNPAFSLGLGYGNWRGGGLGLGFDWPYWNSPIPAYVTEVSLVMRDLQSGQIVYDTRARHQGVRNNINPVLAALFVAALQGYPNPPQSVRRVDVPLIPLAPPAAPEPSAAPAPVTQAPATQP